MLAAIPTPMHLLDKTATVYLATESKGDPGDLRTSWSSSFSVRCNLQPANSNEAVLHQQVTGNATYDCFLAPTNTDGSAITTTQTQWKTAKVVINTVEYRTAGLPLDQITNGCIWRLTLERTDSGTS